MAIGPVQLIVLGFNHPRFHGEIIEELERLRESDTVRVIDSLAVYKDAEGEIEVMHLSNLSKEEATELGSKVAAVPKPNDSMECPTHAKAEIHQTLLVRFSDRPSLYWSMEPTIRLSPGDHQPLRTPCLSLHNATHITPRNKKNEQKGQYSE